MFNEEANKYAKDLYDMFYHVHVSPMHSCFQIKHVEEEWKEVKNSRIGSKSIYPLVVNSSSSEKKVIWTKSKHLYFSYKSFRPLMDLKCKPWIIYHLCSMKLCTRDVEKQKRCKSCIPRGFPLSPQYWDAKSHKIDAHSLIDFYCQQKWREGKVFCNNIRFLF